MEQNLLKLRPFLPTDQPRILETVTSTKVNQTYMLPDFEKLEDAIPLFERLAERSRDESRFVRCIDVNGQAVGFLNDVEIKDGSIELGYVIHPESHNLGYMTRALKAAIDELFTLNFERVVCGAFEGNKASQRVMEKAGMTKIDFTEIIEYRGTKHLCVYYEKRSR